MIFLSVNNHKLQREIVNFELLRISAEFSRRKCDKEKIKIGANILYRSI